MKQKYRETVGNNFEIRTRKTTSLIHSMVCDSEEGLGLNWRTATEILHELENEGKVI